MIYKINGALWRLLKNAGKTSILIRCDQDGQPFNLRGIFDKNTLVVKTKQLEGREAGPSPAIRPLR